MKARSIFSPHTIIAFTALALAWVLINSLAPGRALADRNGGEAEPCTTQICPDVPADAFPIVISVVYQNGEVVEAHYHASTIAVCPTPPPEGRGGLGGSIIQGAEGSGNIEQVVIGGLTIEDFDGESFDIEYNNVPITVNAHSYEGHNYVHVRHALAR